MHSSSPSSPSSYSPSLLSGKSSTTFAKASSARFEVQVRFVVFGVRCNDSDVSLSSFLPYVVVYSFARNELLKLFS